MLAMLSVRGVDPWGSGAFGASRDGGQRRHKGVDFAACKDTVIMSQTEGVVTKIGYPYSPEDPDKGHYRYVQVTTPDGINVRYLYINPLVKNGDDVFPGKTLGTVQSLGGIYPGITDHCHVSVKQAGHYIDPILFLESVGVSQ